MMSSRPMTRFIQYPFDKTKMEEVRTWINETSIPEDLRKEAGVRDIEFSFCPGQGWLAARYIFNDLDDLKALPESSAWKNAKELVSKHPHYDNSRQPQEFKGFYLNEV